LYKTALIVKTNDAAIKNKLKLKAQAAASAKQQLKSS
jgi:hypothetical protein